MSSLMIILGIFLFLVAPALILFSTKELELNFLYFLFVWAPLTLVQTLGAILTLEGAWRLGAGF